MKGILFVVSAPSGCGKGAVLAHFTKRGDIHYSVSATTRKPREGEVDGVNYRFVSRESFEALIENGDMLEYAEYCGHYYGTPMKPVMDTLNGGGHVLLEIEVKGAMAVREKYPGAVLIFILPPSLEELERRLLKRGQDTEESMTQRLAAAVMEMKFAGKYDYLIVNDELETAVEDFRSVIRAEELKAARNCRKERG
jgi:guanylate kinase